MIPPSVAVLGAGAVGNFFGAMLARAGFAVTLIGRSVHIEAIRRDGLRVLEAEREWRVDVRGITDIRAPVDADLVLVTVKTPDTDAAVRALGPQLRPGARVVSLQNGVDNAARIAVLLAQPVYSGVVYVGASMEGPGRVRHIGGGDLTIGAPRPLAARGGNAARTDSDLRGIAAMFDRAGVPCTVTSDIELALWTKLALNCAFNAVSALGAARYDRMAASASTRSVMEAALRETVDVARADGIPLDAEELVGAMWALAAAMSGQISSTAQDMKRGKPTEIDALNGYVARRGTDLGVPTPVNRTLHALVKLHDANGMDTQAIA